MAAWVNLHVEVYPHTGESAKPDGAALITEGGPGRAVSVGAKYGYTGFLLADYAQTHDLVFVDQRGLGKSDVIDCPDLQHGGPFYRSAARCHDQLGDAANMYSTTDVADDLDDVRAALGYHKVDLVGGSYAGTDMLTYSVRHKKHVRAVALGAPAVQVGADPFYAESALAIPGMVRRLCGRSPLCDAAHPDPKGDLAWLAKRLRHHPVTGTAIDYAGESRTLTVTESTLAAVIPWYGGSAFDGLATLSQVAHALRRGDDKPLLRLAANAVPVDLDQGDVNEFSVGHNLARTCVETPLAWDRTAPAGARIAQYAKALAKQPVRYGPFARDAWASPGYVGHLPQPCIASKWKYRPNYSAGTKVTGVPAVILGGEYDLAIPESLAVQAKSVLVGSKYVSMKAVGHVPWWFSDCGPQIVQAFLADPKGSLDTSCATVAPRGWWYPGSYPTSFKGSPAATQVGGPAADADTRRLITTVAWTAMESLINWAATRSDTTVGLRGEQSPSPRLAAASR